MNISQKIIAETNPVLLREPGDKKNTPGPHSQAGRFLNGQKIRINESKKKINRFFEGLPFNPEP